MDVRLASHALPDESSDASSGALGFQDPMIVGGEGWGWGWERPADLECCLRNSLPPLVHACACRGPHGALGARSAGACLQGRDSTLSARQECRVSRLEDSGESPPQVTGYRLQVTGYRLQATGYRLQAHG